MFRRFWDWITGESARRKAEETRKRLDQQARAAEERELMRKQLMEANRRIYEMRRERWVETEPSLTAIRQDWDRREREALEKKRSQKKIQDFEEQARKRRAEEDSERMRRLKDDSNTFCVPIETYDTSSSTSSDNIDSSSSSYDGGGGDFSGGGSSGSWSND